MKKIIFAILEMSIWAFIHILYFIAFLLLLGIITTLAIALAPLWPFIVGGYLAYRLLYHEKTPSGTAPAK